jgi:undecaprenyl-diphosphatase
MACALIVPFGAVIAYIAQQLIDNGVNEARPYAIHPDILVLVSRTTDPSFPSDHACAAGAIAAGLYFVNRKLGIVATLCAAILAFSRVYSGAHWPMDVIAGLAFGAAIAVAVMLILRTPLALLVEKLRTSPLRWALQQ